MTFRGCVQALQDVFESCEDVDSHLVIVCLAEIMWMPRENIGFCCSRWIRTRLL